MDKFVWLIYLVVIFYYISGKFRKSEARRTAVVSRGERARNRQRQNQYRYVDEDDDPDYSPEYADDEVPGEALEDVVTQEDNATSISEWDESFLLQPTEAMVEAGVETEEAAVDEPRDDLLRVERLASAARAKTLHKKSRRPVGKAALKQAVMWHEILNRPKR